MDALPADLAEPLHILEPRDWPWEALLLALLLGFLLRWWRKRKRQPKVIAEAIPQPRKMEGDPLAQTLNDLRRQTVAVGDYRQGCHDLASTLRQHQETESGKPFTRWTAPEILARGEKALGSFFDLLADLRFRQKPPTRSEFESAIDLAKDVFSVDEKR